MPTAAAANPLDKHVPVVVGDESGRQELLICRYINRRGMIVVGKSDLGIGDVVTVEFRGAVQPGTDAFDRIGAGDTGLGSPDGFQLVAEVVAITAAGIGMRFIEGERT